MSALKYIAPFASIAFFTVLAALPWGLPADDRFFLPLLPCVAIHYWAMRRPDHVPEWFVFAAGLLLDVFTHGPLGYWSLIYLLAQSLGVLGTDAIRSGVGVRLGLFAASLAAVTAVSWIVASIYFLEFADWVPYARAAVMAGLASIVIIPILHVLEAPSSERGSSQLTRGS